MFHLLFEFLLLTLFLQLFSVFVDIVPVQSTYQLFFFISRHDVRISYPPLQESICEIHGRKQLLLPLVLLDLAEFNIVFFILYHAIMLIVLTIVG